MSGPTIVWFRRDLRLADHPALHQAVQTGGAAIPVYIHAPHEAGRWRDGAASRWWLHHALVDLSAQLARAGARLTVRDATDSSSWDVLRDLVEVTGATRVVWSRCYEPALIERDRTIKAHLKAAGIETESYNGSLLFEPWDIAKNDGGPYRVFTPYWRTCMARPAPSAPLPRVTQIKPARELPDSLAIDALNLLPHIRWDAGLAQAWEPTETAVTARLDHFLRSSVAAYPQQRDIPGVDGTSRLSPYLHHGQISPRTIWHKLTAHLRTCDDADRDDVWAFARQIGWREFAYHLLYHEPHTPESSLQEKYQAFPWRTGKAAQREFDAWQRGMTGYPMVDAGMRQLWQTGWMHNRVRMVVASFLVKHLLIDWRQGADWFWDTLVDADLANNTLGWQWAAGCGADAAPYFRIFNPMTQGKKFDEDGQFVRTWCPELGKLPQKYLHCPFEAPASILAEADVTLGENYPRPIVDHKVGRERALEALATVSGG